MPSPACWPCRERKLKCDFGELGLPCTRCKSNDCVDDCRVPPRQKRKIVNIARRRTKHRRLDGQLDGWTHTERGTLLEDDTTYLYPDAANASQTADEQAGQAIDTDEIHLPTSQFRSEPGDGIDPVLSPFVSSSQAPPALPTPTTNHESEEDVLACICEKIAAENSGDPRTILTTAHAWAEGIEYQNSFNATGILGEVLARRESTRLIRINHSLLFRSPKGNEPRSRRDMELFGLEDDDVSYLTVKGVFLLPPRAVCEGFFEVYFRYVYPYAPVLDRGELLAQFDKGEASSFLLQALLANVVPYAKKELITQAGFSDHSSAQKAFYKRATLLYDFNCEKSQLTLLQGSLLLGTQWVSYFGDKDYQFWMCNAIRLSTRMGINRRHIEEELDLKSYKLLKRIWWTIYIRDVLTTISGLDNGRPARPRHDTSALDESDWPDEGDHCPERLQYLLPPVQPYHKQFFIQLSQLALIGHNANRTVLDRLPVAMDPPQILKLLDSLYEWRSGLPRELRVESVRIWSDEGIWYLVLLAWCVRLECMIFRTLRKAESTVDDLGPATGDASKRLNATIFELDALVRRAVVHQIGKLLPMSFSTAVATLISLCIEMLLRSPAPSEKLMCEEAIRTSIAFMIDSQETWPCLRWILRMFDWAFTHAGLESSHFGLELPAKALNVRDQDLFTSYVVDTEGLDNLFFSRPVNDVNGDLAFFSAGTTPDWQGLSEM